MSQPEPPPPPAVVGTQPTDANTLNLLVGTHLRTFMQSRATINQDASFLAATDLKAFPYGYSADQETLIKSAIADLDTTLDGIDLTFISRIVGM